MILGGAGGPVRLAMVKTAANATQAGYGLDARVNARRRRVTVTIDNDLFLSRWGAGGCGGGGLNTLRTDALAAVRAMVRHFILAAAVFLA